MSSSLTIRSGRATVLPISYGYVPDEGSMSVLSAYNWSGQTSFTDDLSQLMGAGTVTTIQSVVIDNSSCTFAVTLTLPGSGQVIVCPAASQGIFPLFLAGGGFSLSVPQVTQATTRLTFSNEVLAPAVFAAGTPTLDLNFLTGGPVDSRIAYPGSGGSYFNATGALVSPATTNVPRIDYGPTPGGVTNLIPNSTLAGAVGGNPGKLPTGWTIGSLGGVTTSVVTVNGGQFPYLYLQITGTPTVTGNIDLLFTALVTTPYTSYIESVYTAMVAGNLSNIAPICLVVGSGGPAQCGLNTTATLTRVVTAPANLNIANLSPGMRFSFTIGQPVNVTFAIGGPQFEQASTAGAYLPTSGAAATFGAVPLGMLIEEARTNSIPNPRGEGAVVGTPGTLPTGWSQSGTNGLAFNVAGFGSEQGIPYVDLRLNGTPTDFTDTVLAFIGSQVTAASAGQAWAGTVYCRQVAGSQTNVVGIQAYVIANSAAGAPLGNTAQPLSPTTNPLAGQRVEIDYTLPASTAFVQMTFQVSPNSGSPVDLTLRIGAPQLELGASATSVILPAPGAQTVTTRTADAATIGAAGNTLFAAPLASLVVGVLRPAVTTTFANLFNLTNQSSQNVRSFFRANGAEPATAFEGPGLTGGFDTSGNYIGAPVSHGVSWNTVNFWTADNGNAGAAGVAIGGPILTPWDTLSIAPSFLGWVQRVRYWRRTLPPGELQSVTK